MRSVTNLRRAADLLYDDSLVWSKDMESFRKPLADLLAVMATNLTAKELSYIEPGVSRLCNMLTAGEDDLVIAIQIEELKLRG